jgi:AbrB family looped-hinge helix DNA binding protein
MSQVGHFLLKSNGVCWWALLQLSELRPSGRAKKNPFASIHVVYYDYGIDMNTVTVSPKFQVVIPLAVREAMRLSPGEKLRVMRYDDRIEFIPVRPIRKMRGFLKGMDTTIEREGDRL